MFNVLWLQSGGCGGCSMSLLCADTADFTGMWSRSGLRLLWHPSLSAANGPDLLALLDDCLQGRVRLDALCLEGAVLRNNTGMIRFVEGLGFDVQEDPEEPEQVHTTLELG